MDVGTKEKALEWNVSQAKVSEWCRKGLIAGATQDKRGSPWHIPKDASKPIIQKTDHNKKGEKNVKGI